MFQSYFLTALRNLIKNPVYSAINVFGLSLGLACCITILIFLTYQLSYDTQFKDFERIHLLQTTNTIQGNEFTFPGVSGSSYELIRDNLAEIEATVSLEAGHVTVKIDQEFSEKVHYTQNSFFEIFDFHFIEGDRNDALTDPSSVVLTASTAKKYFGSTSPIGKTLPLADRILTVTGVIDDIPVNTHFKNMGLSILAHSEGKPQQSRQVQGFSFRRQLNAYLKLREGASIPVIEKGIAELLPKENSDASRRVIQRPNEGSIIMGQHETKVTILPIRNSHLSSQMGRSGSALFQNWYFIYIAGGLALAVLIISCINFINLTTARFTQRNREIGLRKVMGADRHHIFGQFICETLTLTVLAVLIALATSHFSLPWFGFLVQTDLTDITYATPFFLLSMLGLIVVTTLLAGFYPAMVLSRVNPIHALTRAGGSNARSRLRKILTVAQFTFSILLITTCLTLYYQVNHLKNLDLGFNLKNVATVTAVSYSPGEAPNSKADVLRAELLSHPSIQSISNPIFGASFANTEYQIDGTDNDPVKLSHLNADHEFLEHYQIELLAGRPFTKGLSTEVTSIPLGQAPQKGGAVILTLTGMEKLGVRSARSLIGKKLVVPNDTNNIELGIIGVADAFPKVLEERDLPIGADFIALSEEPARQLSIRIRDGQLKQGTEHIKSVLSRVMSNNLSTPRFPKQMLDTMFSTMTRALSSVTLFAVIAIIIAMMGLYAMSTFTVERRTREVGIRKVMGASVLRITSLLLWDFSKPVLIALALATPLAYLGANFVIQHIAARIPLELITFGVVPALTMLIAWITVSTHTLKAANTNPVVAIRYE